MKMLPGDRWLKLYVEVYRACLRVSLFGGTTTAIEGVTAEVTDAALAQALALSRASDFRMKTLVLVYRSRFELARGAASAAANGALARARDPIHANPFDEILALAELDAGPLALDELSQAAALAARTGNVLQDGILQLALAERTSHADPERALAHLDAASARFAVARADSWLKRVQSLRRA